MIAGRRCINHVSEAQCEFDLCGPNESATDAQLEAASVQDRPDEVTFTNVEKRRATE